jgi:hypothetical protein
MKGSDLDLREINEPANPAAELFSDSPHVENSICDPAAPQWADSPKSALNSNRRKSIWLHDTTGVYWNSGLSRMSGECPQDPMIL